MQSLVRNHKCIVSVLLTLLIVLSLQCMIYEQEANAQTLETDTIFEFDYDGLTPSDRVFTASGYAYTSLSDPLRHPISFILVDNEGNNNGTIGYTSITLEAVQEEILPVSQRTPQVRDAIVAAVPGVDIGETQLARS